MPLDRPIRVVFFRLDSGREPVREWLKGLNRESRKSIGEDIKTLQFGWPVGMPLARKIGSDLWELRSHVTSGIARTFFTVDRRKIVLLHGFVKKSQKTPSNELVIAKRRLTKLRSETNLSKAEMARRMETSRSALDRLLDPDNSSVTLQTLQSAVKALGGRLKIELDFQRSTA
jgi:phage-related protein